MASQVQGSICYSKKTPFQLVLSVLLQSENNFSSHVQLHASDTHTHTHTKHIGLYSCIIMVTLNLYKAIICMLATFSEGRI